MLKIIFFLNRRKHRALVMWIYYQASPHTLTFLLIRHSRENPANAFSQESPQTYRDSVIWIQYLASPHTSAFSLIRHSWENLPNTFSQVSNSWPHPLRPVTRCITTSYAGDHMLKNIILIRKLELHDTNEIKWCLGLCFEISNFS